MSLDDAATSMMGFDDLAAFDFCLAFLFRKRKTPSMRVPPQPMQQLHILIAGVLKEASRRCREVSQFNAIHCPFPLDWNLGWCHGGVGVEGTQSSAHLSDGTNRHAGRPVGMQ